MTLVGSMTFNSRYALYYIIHRSMLCVAIHGNLNEDTRILSAAKSNPGTLVSATQFIVDIHRESLKTDVKRQQGNRRMRIYYCRLQYFANFRR